MTQNSKKIIVGLLVVVVAAAVAWAILPHGLDKQVVEQQLQLFSTRVTQEAAKKGHDVNFRYDEVDIRGGFWNRHAVVVNPRFEGTEGTVAMSVNTQEMTITPESKDFHAFTFALPYPIELYEAARKAAKVQFDTPPSFVIRREEKDGTIVNTSESTLPEKIELFRYVQAEGETEPKETRQLIITADAGSELTSAWDDAGNTLASHAKFSNLKVVNEENRETFSVASLTLNMTNLPKVGSTRFVQYDIAVKDLVIPPEINPYGPLQAAISVEYLGEVPDGLSQMQMPVGKEAKLTLRNFSVSTSAFGLNAVGQIESSATDFMPTGVLNVNIEHADAIIRELEKSGWLSPEDKQLLSSILLKATGKPLEESETIVLQFKREPGGKFFVGAASFDEILATLMLATPPSAVVPPVTPEGETSGAPAAAPAPVTAPAPAR